MGSCIQEEIAFAPAGNVKSVDCAINVAVPAKLVAMYKIAIIINVPVISERNRFPLDATTGHIIKNGSVARSTSGSTLFPGRMTASKRVTGIMISAAEITIGDPVAMAASIPMLTSFPGNFLPGIS